MEQSVQLTGQLFRDFIAERKKREVNAALISLFDLVSRLMGKTSSRSTIEINYQGSNLIVEVSDFHRDASERSGFESADKAVIQIINLQHRQILHHLVISRPHQDQHYVCQYCEHHKKSENQGPNYSWRKRTDSPDEPYFDAGAITGQLPELFEIKKILEQTQQNPS